MRYFAKSDKDISVEQHCQEVEESADIILNKYASQFSDTEKKLIKLACRYHDYGKCNANFIKRMYDLKHLNVDEKILEAEKIYKELNYEKLLYPHGYLSCAFIPQDEELAIVNEDEMDYTALVNAIVYHHSRKKLPEYSEITKIIKEDLKKRFENINFNFRDEIWYKTTKRIDVPTDELWVKYAIIKGILNRADYYASGNKDYPIEIDGLYEKECLGKRINRMLHERYGNLREVQRYMYDNKDNNVVVVASTGSGKTEGAFLWADASKTFYTLPLQVSINAIYERIVETNENTYGYSEDKISILHSNAVSYMLKRDKEEIDELEEVFKKYSVAKNLAYPVTICTVDQLFTFVYKYLGSEIFLATLKYSKLVIDEIQAYSPELIAKLIYGLKLLSMAGGKFAIMTATMPPVVRHFMDINGIEYKFEKFILDKNRHKIAYYTSDFDYEKIIDASKEKKVLVICNTVGRAQEVYESLNDKCENIHLLHARYLHMHKQILEDAIMDFSKGNDCGVWVTTQIVEASLDIDFDILFTEMCTADSLLQRMGRCFRKREYLSEEPNVYIYNDKEVVDKMGNKEKRKNSGYGTVYDKSLYDRSAEFIKKYNHSLFKEQQKFDYIEKVYNTEELRSTECGIYSEIDKNIKICEGIFQGEIDGNEAKKKFRDIETHTLIPNSVYEFMINNELMDEINEKLSSNNMIEKERGRNELMQYVVTSSYIHNETYSINENLDKLGIKRTMCLYEFDDENLKGRGLMTVEGGLFI